MKYFIWLAEQAFDGILYVWPVSLILIVLLCLSLFLDISKQRLRLTDFPCLYPLLGTVTILGMGTVYEKDEHLYYLPYVGFVFCLLLAVFVVIKLRRIWKTALAISLCILWYSLLCGFVSVMSITGDWL